MSLPSKNEKGYLEVSQSESGFAIVGKKEHTSELALLYGQNGIGCHRESAGGPEEERLRFERDVTQAQLQEGLESYQNAQGS